MQSRLEKTIAVAVMVASAQVVACRHDNGTDDAQHDSGAATTEPNPSPRDAGTDASIDAASSSNPDASGSDGQSSAEASVPDVGHDASSSTSSTGEGEGSSTSTLGSDGGSHSPGTREAGSAGPGTGEAGSGQPGTGEAGPQEPAGPDLTISSVTLSAAGFTSVEVSDASCEIQDGCYTGPGLRTVIPFELTITNSGSAPLTIGAPWESDAFHLSACASQHRTTNFVKAEVLGGDGEVLAVRHLPTACIADEHSSQFTCTIQGLDVGDESSQPSQACNGLDVTGLAAGAYSVRFTVNANGAFDEADTSNNTFEVTLDKPECEERFCGGVCCPESAECVDDRCLLPDLRANEDAVERSLIIKKQTFSEDACELEEQCVTGPGKRRLLQFEGRIENVGEGDLNPGREEGNPLFSYSQCHDHYHFLDFTDYKLLNADGSVAVQGHKQSFCLVDMARVEDYESPVLGEVVHPEPGDRGCSYLSAGWADIYSVGTPCQWVDVTDVAPGDYVLQVAVNPSGKIAEGNVENNVVQVAVHIPADAPCQEQEVCGDVADQDCDSLPDTADGDCFDTPLCCGPSDTCGLGDNFQCDCGGLPEWEHHDCEATDGDGGGLGECCSEDNVCNWENDGECDCGAQFDWDELDCNRIPGNNCCTEANACDWANDQVCDCGGSMSWDFADCAGMATDGGVITVPPMEPNPCCTQANLCSFDNDGFCDCEGSFSWDAADCANAEPN